MELKPCDFSDLSNASYSYSLCNLPSSSYSSCLVVAFSGEAGNSHEHTGTFAFMDAILAAGLAGWAPRAIVVDLRELKYEWSDNMATVVGVGQGFYQDENLPSAIVVSDLNRDGMTSLVRDELLEEPTHYLHETLREAVEAVDRIVQERLT